MSRKSRAIRDRRIRLTLWGALFLTACMVYFCLHPFIWRTESRLQSGGSITLEAISDYLIVIDYSATKSPAETFAEMSFSLAWLNTFQQEIGPVSVMNSAEFKDAELTTYRCLVLTSSAAQIETLTPKVRGFLERGGTVIMEMPAPELRTLASADGKGGIRTTQNMTYAMGLSPEYTQALSDIDLSSMTYLVGSAGPLEDSQTWMTIDGVPVIYSRKYATGRVITVDFNYGMLLTSLQQGRPLDDFSIRNVRDTNKIETSDLAQSNNLNVPVADVLERFLVYNVLNDSLPVVSMWPYFDGLDGAVVVSHQEKGSGDPALWMSSYEATFKATSTIFVTAPLKITDPGLDILDTTNAEIGLAFDASRDQASRAREPMGFFKISPVWRILNIEEQTEVIKARLDEKTPFLTAQSLNGLWSSDYTGTFQMLSAAGFRADTSYRASIAEPGYAFSTGMPFMPIDTNSLIFNIMEFPISFPQLRNAEQSEAFERFLADSEKDHHEVIGVSFDPGDYPANPIAESFQVWQSMYRQATQHKHWVTSVLNYFRFSRARYTAELKSRYSEMTVNHKKANVLRIETLAPEAGMSLTVPKSIGERNFVESRRGLQRAREDSVLADPIATRPITIDGFERILVPLSKGFNAIDVMYE